MEKLSCKLTIFEGCDGSGKTTAAKTFASETGAAYVHFSALPHVSSGLARMYVEAMLPALLGYQDVVFDRSWISENPYGVVFRDGQDRLGDSSRRMLERLALRCGVVVVRCNPGWDAVLASYTSRRHLEMLEDSDQLQQVFDLYTREQTDLPQVHYDYTVGFGSIPYNIIETARTGRHQLEVRSAGNWDANTLIVGENFADRKDNDPFYQWPFASFSQAGCSQWFTDQLKSADISEFDLLWVNSDQDLSFIHDIKPGRIFALGDVAHNKLLELGVDSQYMLHPQYFKRFHSGQHYPLLDKIRGY